jgi:ACS family D-galactonate transporter-like MFS transporter
MLRVTTGSVRRVALSLKESRVLALLAISGVLNYVDRANLSVGATSIQQELHLSTYDLGVLLSAFFWTYATFQLFVISGWLVDRFNVGWVFAAGFFIWSGATAITGVARGFAVIFALRLLLGIGESIAYPAYSRILANHFPEHHRGFANAVIDAGTKTGPALGTLAGGLLMARYGWRAFFVALGFSSLLWLVPWFYWMPRGKGTAAPEDTSAIPGVFTLLRHSEVWWSAVGLFSSNYYWYFLITWLPPYLETERHFPKSKMAVVGSVAFLCISISSVISGWLSDRWIARGATPTKVRKTFAGTGLTLATIILPVCVVQQETLAIVLLLLACASFGLYSSNVYAITQTLAGPRAAGKWTGFQNGVANLAGVVAPWLTGWVVQTTGQFYLAFVVAAGFVLAAAAIFTLGIRRVEQVKFEIAKTAIS